MMQRGLSLVFAPGRSLHAPGLAAIVMLAVVAFATPALADARVDVEVKDSAGRLTTARVSLTKGNVTKSCSTVGGRCSITIAAGAYQVQLKPPSGATQTSTFSVPATGVVRLALRINVATTTATTTAPTTAPTATATTTTTTEKTQGRATTAVVNLRNVSRGTRLLVQGSVKDASGRLTTATITLEQNGRPVAQAKCVGGRFSMYDLAAGTYTVVANGPNATRASAKITVGRSLLRPTLRLAPR